MWGVAGSSPERMTIFITTIQQKMEHLKFIRETRQTVIDQMLEGVQIIPGSRVLEPSAGSGNLVQGILNKYPYLSLYCVELNKELRDILKSKKFNVIGEDFFKLTPDPRYDFVIATPTYKDNVDVEHIMHMYNFIREGGTIISLTYPAWTTHNSDRQRKFRYWLEDKNYSMKMLKDNSFVENFDTQPSMIITITK